MRLKDISRNKMTDHKKRIDMYKKDLENKDKIKEKTETKEISKDKTIDDITKDKTIDDITKDKTIDDITKDKTIDDITKDKKIIRNRPSKEAIEEIKRKAEEKVYRRISGEKPPEEPKHEISKEERTERFERLHKMAVQMTKQWEENNKSRERSKHIKEKGRK